MDSTGVAAHGHGVTDTIAAIATAPGRGGIGIVRISGSLAAEICAQVCGGPSNPRVATLRHFRAADGSSLDTGIALFFPAPHSYTGEDVLELQGHGGSIVLQLVLERTVQCGARRARPGEFTERAFLNGRLDLTQAEAVADLIDAASVQAARAAQRSLSGVFSGRVAALSEALMELRMQLEVALDFPEEDIDPLADGLLQQRTVRLLERMHEAIDAATAGRKLNDAIHVVIAGAPNVGKSSLLNALLGTRRAIVTEVPGTTRDIILEQVVIQGLQLQLCDTAGLRDSEDVVEMAGIALTRERIADADIVLQVADARSTPGLATAEHASPYPELAAQSRVMIVLNKIDLSGHSGGEHHGVMHVSAKTGDGMAALREALAGAARELSPHGDFTARQRHLDCLRSATQHAVAAHSLMAQLQGTELVAEELRLAQKSLEELTGRVTSDEILGRIFESFCIGK